MSKKRRGIWIALSVLLACILGVTAAGYNAAIVADYYRLVELARELEPPQQPTFTLTLGNIGFAASILGVMIFLFRLLREMKLNQEQSEFIARVSHELKTPLATIELTADLLKDQEKETLNPALDLDERTRLWHSHSEELHRLKRQVHSLLETARWQVSPPPVRRSAIQLQAWLDSQKTRWSKILGPTTTLEFCGDRLDFEVMADPEKLELIFLNLIENARKFSRSGAEPSLVRIRSLRQSDEEWAIQVEDTGWGFPKELSKRLFTRFYRAPHGAPYAIAGSGLGLHLAATAAHAMGLKLTGKSDGVGLGAVFKLEGRQ